LNHVFVQVPDAFNTAAGNIPYVPIESKSSRQALTNAQGEALRPVQVMHLPLPEDGDQTQWAANDHLHHMAQGFASTMVQLLAQHPDVKPGDMAVLVRSHAHAKAMQTALRQRHLPSVFLSDNANVFQSEEALDLWRVLRAIASPRQTAWMRSALASGLWGLSLAQLPAMLHDEAHADALAESCQRWLQQWQHSGVLPMLHSWMHEQHIAARLLAQPWGERRLTNLLHLGELLQTASQHVQGPLALLQYLADNMAHISDNPEAQKMRLETDAQCVQIITFHKSKGLEYPLVFVPFLGSLSATDRQSKAQHDDDDEAPDPTETSVDEDMRLLYVALTRAQRGVWLGLASTAKSVVGKDDKLKLSAISRLLQRKHKDDLWERIQAAWGNCSDIALQDMPTPKRKVFAGLPSTAHTQNARTPQRAAHKLWWTASFSSLTRDLEAGSSREEADTELTTPWQSFPAGARYGTLLHDLLQYQAQNNWPIAYPSEAPTPAWQALLQRKTDWLQLPLAAQEQLPPWLHTIVTTPLPLASAEAPAQTLASPLVLQRLTPTDVWAEMEFSLPVGQLNSKAMDALIQQHVLPGHERPALQAKLMQGMLSGFMDLVLQHDGRYWVVDYKSNLLPNYALPQLTSAVLAKRYEVQYVLYTLALHRLLTSRLPNYHYETHMGGAIYVFLRGIDTPSAGVHALRPSWALIEQLDHLFAKVTA
jgi:exodeoxyribonuclease V beta subunit